MSTGARRRWIGRCGRLGLFLFSALGASAAIVEVDGLTIEGADPVGVLAAREWAEAGHRHWAAMLPERGQDLRPATLQLVPTAPAGAVLEPLTAQLVWSEATRLEALVHTLAALWLRRSDPSGGEPVAWSVDWLAVSLLAARTPGGEGAWLARAGAAPLAEARLLAGSGRTESIVAQSWLYGEFRAAEADRGGALASGAPFDRETRWAAWFLARTGEPRGPFLDLAESSRRLRALGQVNVLLRGVETRVWLHELPAATRRQWPELVASRRAHLRSLLPRIHPVFHRAATALTGALEEGPAAEAFARAFLPAWSEAEGTADEIRQLLATP